MALSTSLRGAPLHYQIQRILRAKITSGEWTPTDRLPTELALMARFRVSRTTIRQALFALQEDGLIIRRPRHGTFVNPSRNAHGRRPVITNAVMGYQAEVRLVRRDETKPPHHIAPLLGLTGEDAVSRFLRLEAVEAAPLCVVINYLPVALGRRISLQALRRRSMFELLEKTLRIRLRSVEQTLEARLPDDEVAALLEISLSDPILFSRLFVSDTRGQPVQVVDAFYRADRTSYEVEFPYLPHLATGTWRTATLRRPARRAGWMIPRLKVRPPM